MHFKKMVASLAAAVILCLNFSAVSYAEMVNPFEDYGISLTYEIATSCKSDLEIISGTAYCTSIAEGTDAVSITVTQTLQKHWGLWIWTDVKGAEWTRTENRNSVRLSNSISGLDSGTYRLKSVFTLTDKNGKSEKIKIYSNEQEIS